MSWVVGTGTLPGLLALAWAIVTLRTGGGSRPWHAAASRGPTFAVSLPCSRAAPPCCRASFCFRLPPSVSWDVRRLRSRRRGSAPPPPCARGPDGAGRHRRGGVASAALHVRVPPWRAAPCPVGTRRPGGAREAAGTCGGVSGRGGRCSGVSLPVSCVLTGVHRLGTLRPCAWGVPWPSCVPTTVRGACIGHRNLRLFRLRRGSAVFDTPDRVGRRRSRLALLHGTQKPEK